MNQRKTRKVEVYQFLFSSPGHLPDPGIEPASPALAGRFFITEPPGKSNNKALITS